MRRALIALGIGLVTISSGAVTVPAWAAVEVATVKLADTSETARQVAQFWLADDGANLRAATPYTVHTEMAAERSTAEIVPDGKPGSFAPVAAGGPAAPDGTAPTPSGKVYFIGSDNEPHWCTGTAVQGQYRNLVATAGHCVFDVEAPMGALGKWVFVPGHAAGTAPFGLYVGKLGTAPYPFDDVRDYDRDYAFANVYQGVVSSSPGAFTNVGRLLDVVGGQGFAYNQPVGPPVDVLGFPAGAHPDGSRPYSGATLERSAGATFAASVGLPRMDQPVGAESPFTGAGSIGSAWLSGYAADSGLGLLSGVTISVSDTDGDGRYDTGVSPYFGTEAAQVWRRATLNWTGVITR
ncbi:hypothetical protein [Nonomuraea fuscirosea]|uniref:hypothetical protein n=1 Tax=Nonomuraea fuscirosea TaxID=1291556 RepID=UPI00343AA6D9